MSKASIRHSLQVWVESLSIFALWYSRGCYVITWPYFAEVLRVCGLDWFMSIDLLCWKYEMPQIAFAWIWCKCEQVEVTVQYFLRNSTSLGLWYLLSCLPSVFFSFPHPRDQTFLQLHLFFWEKSKKQQKTKMSAVNFATQSDDSKICVVMVGLPARGKSLIAGKGKWTSHPVNELVRLTLDSHALFGLGRCPCTCL